MEALDLARLGDFFAPDELEWKPITISKKTNKGLAAAYVTNRAIMDRLDDVCGPENWKNEYQEGPGGGVLCGISIKVGGEWVTKWDGAENTDIEPVKGGLSNSMRRAAVQWGIGRYLYKIESQWVAVDERGRFVQTPRVDPRYLPGKRAEKARKAAQRDEAARPADTGTVTPGALFGFFSQCGFEQSGPYEEKHRALRLAFATAVLDKDVLSFDEITAADRERVYKTLEYLTRKEVSPVGFADYCHGAGLALSDAESLQRAVHDYKHVLTATAGVDEEEG